MDEIELMRMADELYDDADWTFRALLVGPGDGSKPQPIAVLADYSELVVGDGAGADALMHAHYLPDVACAKTDELDPKNVKEFLDADVELVGGQDGLSYLLEMAKDPEAFLKAHGQTAALEAWRDKHAAAKAADKNFTAEVVATGIAKMPERAVTTVYGWRLSLQRS